jgi:hypothetical protein
VNVAAIQIVFLGLILVKSTAVMRFEIVAILKNLWSLLLQCVQQGVLLIRCLLKRGEGRDAVLFTTFKTAIITLVVLAIFMSLLVNADPVFSTLMSTIWEEAVGRFALSLLLAGVLSALLTVRVKGSDDDASLRFLASHEILIPVASVILLLGVFLFIQVKYLFGGDEAVRAFGYTYSEYVRKGFLELLLASLFGGILSYIVSLKQRSPHAGAHATALQVVNVMLLLELALLLFSALKRDLLYIDIYGLTRVRIIGSIFLVWLAGLLIAFFLFAVQRKVRERHVLGSVFALSMGVFLFLNGYNIDRVIASAVPPRGHGPDVFYISSLSSDAVPDWEGAIMHAARAFDSLRIVSSPTREQEDRVAEVKLAVRNVQDMKKTLEQKYDRERNPREFNWGEYRAFRFMQERSTLFSVLPDCLQEEIENYQLTHNIDLASAESRRLHGYEYPFIKLNRRYGENLDWLREQRNAQHRPIRPPQSCM